MKTLRSVLLFVVAAAAVAFGLRRIMRAKATGLSRDQARELLGAVHASYASTLAALDPNAKEHNDFEERDARASADAETLQRAVETVRWQLAPRLGSTLASFADHVASAQLQIMAFAINRKNRGLPDSAEVEAETEDRQSFQRNAEPLFAQIVAALA